MKRSLWMLLVAVVAQSALSQQSGIVGDWQEPGGSVIRITSCEQDLCARLIRITPQAPSQFDTHNPDPAKRSQRLCGLRIGYDFRPDGPGHADGGQLYDPKTGKTYQGEMTASGDQLDLRGYVGIKAFGRSEHWTRVSAPVAGCA